MFGNNWFPEKKPDPVGDLVKMVHGVSEVAHELTRKPEADGTEEGALRFSEKYDGQLEKMQEDYDKTIKLLEKKKLKLIEKEKGLNDRYNKLEVTRNNLKSELAKKIDDVARKSNISADELKQNIDLNINGLKQNQCSDIGIGEIFSLIESALHYRNDKKQEKAAQEAYSKAKAKYDSGVELLQKRFEDSKLSFENAEVDHNEAIDALNDDISDILKEISALRGQIATLDACLGA
jgi:archaellum component FlaC